jgi:hypothetical protein
MTHSMTATERRVAGQRGWQLIQVLDAAHANIPLRGLLHHALHCKCYEAVAAALGMWDALPAAERAAIKKRAEDYLRPSAIASRIETIEGLIHLIDRLEQEDCSWRTKRNMARRNALLDAYREELALRTMGDPPVQMFGVPLSNRPFPGTAELTDEEKARLRAVKERMEGE